jgi:ABC-type multidrug transport system ATPase subunit
MSQSAPPVLTVRHDGLERSFAAGQDVVVGRDVRADMRVTDPLVSRSHLLLRFDQGKWMAIDNGSLNGIFVNGQRVPVIDIRDGQSINIGSREGPRVTFEIGRHVGPAGRPPATTSVRVGALPGVPPPPRPQPAGVSSPPLSPPQPAARPVSPRQPAAPSAPPSGPQPISAPRSGPQPISAPPSGPQPALQPPRPVTSVPGRTTDVVKVATRMVNLLRPGSETKAPADSVTIGRDTDNDIVVQDVLASRHHAFLVTTPRGAEIHDANSINGTFVNGVQVGSAILTEGAVVTIGNVDLVFSAGTLVRRTEAATRTGGLEVRGVDFSVDHERKLLHNITLTARPGTLTALIGGSGAGKSTLAKLIAGYTRPTSGSVTFEGHDIHVEYASLRSRIGMVPQDDVVHRQLTVNQALGYAAELRLPPDTSKEDRAQVVAQVLEELDLTKHAETRVDKLSGGQRKRASVALELLTGPSLLILDEPTSGLDPALDMQVMMMLRQLADAGRVVLVVTHSLSYLDLCDQVLLMAPGGKIAFCGPPDQIESAMGTTNWAHIFTKVGADPDEANRRFLAQARPPLPVAEAAKAADLGAPAPTDALRQFVTIARRQVRLVVSDRAYFIFLAVLPLVMGALSLTVPTAPGKTGFSVDQQGDAAAPGILMLLTMAAVFMGTALTIRDLIGERPIFLREQAVGLSTTAYLGAKIAVFTVFAIAQSVVATTIAILGKGAPTQPAVLLGNATFELYVTVSATCVAAAMLGLVLSSLVRSNEQIMPLLVVSLMMQMVLCGSLVPVTDRTGLDQVSWAMPSRWGYAASASTVDLWKLVPGGPRDSHFKHETGTWLFDMGTLAALSLLYAGFVRWRIRLPR